MSVCRPRSREAPQAHRGGGGRWRAWRQYANASIDATVVMRHATRAVILTRRDVVAADAGKIRYGATIVAGLIAALNSPPSVGRMSKMPGPANPNTLTETLFSPGVSLAPAGKPVTPAISGMVMSKAVEVPDVVKKALVAMTLSALPEFSELKTSTETPLLYSGGTVPWNRKRG